MDDRILLLKSCCMEIMCLRAACRYNAADQSLTLSSGLRLYRSQLHDTSHHGVSMLMMPIFEFAQSISRLQLDSTEVALLAAVLLMQSGRLVLSRTSLHFPPHQVPKAEHGTLQFGLTSGMVGHQVTKSLE